MRSATPLALSRCVMSILVVADTGTTTAVRPPLLVPCVVMYCIRWGSTVRPRETSSDSNMGSIEELVSASCRSLRASMRGGSPAAEVPVDAEMVEEALKVGSMLICHARVTLRSLVVQFA